MTKLNVLAGLAGAAMLSACASTPATPPVAEVPDARAQCDTAGARATLGRTADDATVEQARTGAGAASVRVLGPNDMATMDLILSRLNVTVNEQRVITGLRCG